MEKRNSNTIIKRIAVGSQAFFKDYEDYSPHDLDHIEFQENPKFRRTFTVKNKQKTDLFIHKYVPKEEFLICERIKSKKNPMAAGEFLVPETAEFLELTLEELRTFDYAFSHMDPKHIYEKIIYDSYLENG